MTQTQSTSLPLQQRKLQPHQHNYHKDISIISLMMKGIPVSAIQADESTVPRMTLKADTAPEDSDSETRQDDDEEPSSFPSIEPISNSHKHQDQVRRVFEAALHQEDWTRVEALLEARPSLARECISMICQGENSTCLPLHFAAGHKTTPVSTIASLVAVHRGSLLATESSGGRLPLHIAVLKGASLEVVEYLCQELPQSMNIKDQEGNLPLHYASMYSSSEIVQLLVKGCPSACKVQNQSDRLPLHLLCARCWDSNPIALETIQAVLTEYPEALKCADRRGRLPLHVSCSGQDPRCDLVQLLVSAYPEALLARDSGKANSTPLELARKFSAGGGVVVAYLQECTKREQRKKYKFLAPFKHVGGKLARRRQCKPDVDALHLHYCYG